MKNLIVLAALLFCGISSDAQVSLAHSYGPAFAQAEFVNLSLSGKKIMVASPESHDTVSGTEGTDTISFYNLDYSFWKRIICPIIPGYSIVNVLPYYPSETLFNTDPLLELAAGYIKNGSPNNSGTIFIVNETGALVDSMINVWPGGSSLLNLYERAMKVYEVDTLGVGFQAVVQTPNGVNIYNLPGSLPCNICGGNGLGVAKTEKKGGFETQPLPNPSSNEVKITFTLPVGASQGNLVLYNTNGQKIKSFQVDNRFGFIMLDNSQLASGVYYYNIEVNGQVSSTQKLVVIK